MLYPVLLSVCGITMGIAFIWDVGSLASRMSARLVVRDPVYAALYRRVPWLNRAFGFWCILFSVGELVYFYGLPMACGPSRFDPRPDLSDGFCQVRP